MHKKKILLVLCFVTAALAVGCGQKKSENNANSVQEEQQDTQTSEKEEIKDTTEKVETIKETKEIIVYYVDPDTGEIQSEERQVEHLQEDEIWTALKERDVLTVDCGLNSCEVNEDEKKIDLDVNEKFGNYLRTMGTTQEEEVLKCVVNTFLDSYHCEQIRITENGQALETSGAVLDGYMTKQ